jgi:integrase
MGGADWPQLLTDYVTELESRGYSRDTIRTRMSYLRRFAASNEPAAARQDLVAWLAHPTWAPATRKSARSSLRVFYAWMVEVGYLEHSPAEVLKPVRVPKHLPRPASEEQVRAGISAGCADTALMVGLAARMGLRRAEVANARREDLTPWGLHVRGKGRRERMVPVPPDLRREIQARPAGYLFPGRFGGHVHPSTVQRKVREAAGVAPHAHRHRFGTVSYAGAKDLLALQTMLGHSSPETTQVYVELSGDGLAAAASAAWQVAA